MKKIILLLLSFLMILSMVACSVDGNKEENVESTNPTTQTTDDILDNVDKSLIVSDIIPEGSTYYHNNSWEYAREIYDFQLGEKLTAGQKIPTLSTGDIFIHNNIMYVYNAEFKDDKIIYIKDENMNGWSARCFVNHQTKEIKILSHIQGKPVISMPYCFISQDLSSNFEKLIIPNTVSNISHLLDYCALNTNIIFEINSTPITYDKCLRFKNPEIDIEHMKETGEIKWYSEFVFTITGDCNVEIKNNIAKEIGDIKMTVEVK